MTWEQLQRSPKHGIGSEKIELNALKANIPPSFGKDVPHLLAFRFDGKKPFVGCRDKSVFHILFIDRAFTLYDH
ncbi:hypothetical protein Barb6_00013 [Bacteroidales bacterium Barb6]|nr:hypothetical protein Barb6XT_00373 [Bacteroidales bacterium Barb6XT]OAV73686.1 hypothetical protein Barb6_00013 [Bacteroidales bacterium Barb6]